MYLERNAQTFHICFIYSVNMSHALLEQPIEFLIKETCYSKEIEIKIVIQLPMEGMEIPVVVGQFKPPPVNSRHIEAHLGHE